MKTHGRFYYVWAGNPASKNLDSHHSTWSLTKSRTSSQIKLLLHFNDDVGFQEDTRGQTTRKAFEEYSKLFSGPLTCFVNLFIWTYLSNPEEAPVTKTALAQEVENHSIAF